MVFRPAMPPTRAAADTLPVKEQFSTRPLLMPTMPPARVPSPPGRTLPSTRRSRTTPPLWNRAKSPAGAWLPRISREEMVWLPPSSVPPKEGMGV